MAEASAQSEDPSIDVARVVVVPISHVNRHTAVPGDYYPTEHPGAVIAGDWDLDAWVIEDRKYYAELRQALLGQSPWAGTEISARFVGPALAESRAWRRRELWLEAMETLRGYERIYRSMRHEGFLSQEELAARRPSGYKPLQFDEISVVVARDGELQVCQGGHRLAIAKAAGVREIPVWIAARHADWHAFRLELAHTCAALGGLAPEPLLHPDLSGIPCSHERADLLARLRGVLPAPPATLVDITPGWGYAARRCELSGFDCVAISHGDRDAALLERLRVAYRGRYAVAGISRAASLAQQRSSGRVDAVLALSGVHEHLASPDAAAALAELLGVCRPQMMVLRGNADDIAFCSSATGLSSILPLPSAGRQVVRLT